MFLKTIFPALFCLLTIHAQESVQACKFNLSRDDLTFSFCMEFHGSEIEKFRTECEEYTAKVEQKVILPKCPMDSIIGSCNDISIEDFFEGKGSFVKGQRMNLVIGTLLESNPARDFYESSAFETYAEACKQKQGKWQSAPLDTLQLLEQIRIFKTALIEEDLQVLAKFVNFELPHNIKEDQTNDLCVSKGGFQGLVGFGTPTSFDFCAPYLLLDSGLIQAMSKIKLDTWNFQKVVLPRKNKGEIELSLRLNDQKNVLLLRTEFLGKKGKKLWTEYHFSIRMGRELTYMGLKTNESKKQTPQPEQTKE